MKGDYEELYTLKRRKNKANQSQFRSPELTKGAGKREKSVATATG
jgi:hypothetical protein